MTDEDRMIAAWVTETGEKWFEGAGFTRKLWRSAWQAARATADHRDSAELEALRLLYREAVYWQSMQSWSARVALKKAIAQVDAAIESQRSGNGESS